MLVRLNTLYRYIICNFFFVYMCYQLFLLIGIDLYLPQLFCLSCGVIGILNINKIKKINICDITVLLYLIFILLNSLLLDFSHHGEFFYKAFIFKLLPIFSYFIGRSFTLCSEDIFVKMKWPLVFAMIIGLYAYFLLPSWYLALKIADMNIQQESAAYFESVRLSGFWSSQYPLPYATLLYSIYLIYKISEGEISKTNVIVLSLCAIVLLLGQLRVTIFLFIIGYLYIFSLNSKSFLRTLKYMLLAIPIIIISYYIISIISSNALDYIQNRASSVFAINERLKDTGGNITSYSLFGDGFGRYGDLARKYNHFAIVDSEYQNQLAELGYIGFSLLVFILSISFLKSFMNRKYELEFIILLFFIIAFIGASALSNSNQYNIIFWFIVGKIWSSQKKYKSNINNIEYINNN